MPRHLFSPGNRAEPNLLWISPYSRCHAGTEMRQLPDLEEPTDGDGNLFPSNHWSQVEAILPPGKIWQCLETFLFITLCYWHLVSKGQRCC